MKSLLLVPGVLVVLAGCAAPGPYYAAQPVDPYQWRTVSVTPVAPGTAARAGSTVTYTTEPMPAPTVAYQPQPVYVQQPVYVPAPAYYSPPGYYYPPVSIGLDFVFSHRSGRGWGGRGWGGRGRR